MGLRDRIRRVGADPVVRAGLAGGLGPSVAGLIGYVVIPMVRGEQPSHLEASVSIGTLTTAFPPAYHVAVLVLPASVDADVAIPEGAPRSFEAGIALAERVGAVAIHAHTSLCNQARVRRAQSVVFAVNAYTIQDGATAAAMRAAGVDGLIVDSPDVV
jgi:hypothetical protein